MSVALIVIDLLEDFFDAKLWLDSAIPAQRAQLVEHTNDLVAMCRRAKIPVIWFRQEFQPDLSDAFPHMRLSGRRYTIAGTPGCQLLTELHVAAEDHVLLKKRFSAFHETPLDELLAQLDVRTVVLAGITTAWCIRSTATDAYQRDLKVIIAMDCTAAFTDEAHQQSLSAMDGYIAQVLTNSALAQHF